MVDLSKELVFYNVGTDVYNYKEINLNLIFGNGD